VSDVQAIESTCEQCEGTGWKSVSGEPGAAVTRCDCFRLDDVQRRMDGADIPPRYQAVDLNNFNLYGGINSALKEAKLIAEKFVDAFPAVDAGLLFEGTAGLGKTHIAVAILRQLISEHGIRGRFVDYRDLLRSIQNSYNPVAETSELEILRPVLKADVLLLDELGTRRPTAWVRDTVTQILNDRYQNKRITLITTNFGDDDSDPSVSTLTERIGPYARSRLFEMCRNVPMHGEDFRRITGSGSVHSSGRPAASQSR
jgi:DNA replication protein DnaC